MVKLVEDKITLLSEADAAKALREAYKTFLGQYPKKESLALLWSQSALETGRWKIIHCYNMGNIKKKHANPKYNIADDGHNWCMFRCNEILNGKTVWFDPPHVQTHFRAYDNAHDGALDYIKFLANQTRYVHAWKEVINGDATAYSHQLKKAGYYTASEPLYTKGVVRLTTEFMNKYDSLVGRGNLDEYGLTEEEKKEIQSAMGNLNQATIDEYFSLTDRNFTEED